MSNNIKRGRTRAFTLFPAMPAGLKPIQQYKYFDLKPNLLSNKDNDLQIIVKYYLIFIKVRKMVLFHMVLNVAMDKNRNMW